VSNWIQERKAFGTDNVSENKKGLSEQNGGQPRYKVVENPVLKSTVLNPDTSESKGLINPTSTGKRKVIFDNVRFPPLSINNCELSPVITSSEPQFHPYDREDISMHQKFKLHNQEPSLSSHRTVAISIRPFIWVKRGTTTSNSSFRKCRKALRNPERSTNASNSSNGGSTSYRQSRPKSLSKAHNKPIQQQLVFNLPLTTLEPLKPINNLRNLSGRRFQHASVIKESRLGTWYPCNRF